MTHPQGIDVRRIERHLQPQALDFAAFGRAARDIADDGAQSRERRLDRLRSLDDAAPNDHARRILQAVQKDVAATRYRNWSELLNYCRFAAAPAGRFLAELHGESDEAAEALEALYAAQILALRVQRCGEDYRRHGRVYIPADWLREAGAAADDLAAAAATPALRRAIARLLDGVDRLLAQSRAGLPALGNRRLRRQAAVALAATARLAAKLRRRDPLAAPVALNAVERAAAAARGRLRR